MLINRNTGGRLSNFELLRLLSMLMVVNLHSFWGYEYGTGVFQAFDFFRESACICAVDTFILISGFFGIRWKVKSLFNLLFQVVFYSFAVYGACIAFNILTFSWHDFIEQFKCFYKSWGFISSYIVLYFISPALNALSDQSSSKRLFEIILVLILANIFIFSLNINITFFIVYLVGRLLNKLDVVNRTKNHAGFAYLMVTFLIFTIVYTLFLMFRFNASRMQSFFFGYNYCGPLVILQGVFLFLLFGRMKFKNNIINWCASSCLAIYLIHMHPSIKNIYYHFTKSLYEKPFFEHVYSLIVLFTCVFLGSILIDKIRIYISNRIYNFINMIWQALPLRFKKFETYIPSSLKVLF